MEACSKFNLEISSGKLFCQSGFCESIRCGDAVSDDEREWDLVEYAGVSGNIEESPNSIVLASVVGVGRISSLSRC